MTRARVRARDGMGFGLRAVLVVAVALLLPAAGGFAASVPALELLAPRNGAEMKAGAAVVIGKTKAGKGAEVELEVNGKAAQNVTAGAGGGFSARIYLLPGRNVIDVSAAGTQVSVSVSATETGRYSYHPDVEKCTECHAAWTKTYAIPAPKELLCYKCHDRKDTGKQVHGPLGGGDCTACHDPHGSGHAALATAGPDTLCTSCHDQRSSESHVTKSRGKPCTDCHDPHSASKAFLQK